MKKNTMDKCKCGAKALCHAVLCTRNDEAGAHTWYRVECSECAEVGHTRKTETAAIQAWNRKEELSNEKESDDKSR